MSTTGSWLLALTLAFLAPAASATVEVGGGGGAGVNTYATAAALPATARDGAAAITLDAHAFYIYNLGSLAWVVQTASTGVIGPGTSVNNELVLWNGTGGNTVKRGTGTGYVKVTSGVVAVAGILSGDVPWNTPGTIGSSTQSTGNFTTLAATQVVASQGTPLAGHGYIFDSDTGMSSPGDGVLDFWVNNVKQMELVGPTLQIRGVDYQFPAGQGSLGDTLVNNGSGVLSWSSSVPWESPGTIGSTTPNTGAFTTLSANARIIGTESADYTTGGFLFGESGTDTGFTSPSDGVIYQYGNSSIGSKWDSNGISEMRGVTMLFPNTQGAASTVLTNDGAGALSWAAPVAPIVTNTPLAVAGYDVTTGNLGRVPDLSYDVLHGNGLQHQNTYDPFLATGGFITHSFNNTYNPTADVTGLNYGQMQFTTGLGTDDAGFNIDADGSGTYTQSNFYLDGTHKMSVGDIQTLTLGANFGNGTDAMTGKRFRGITYFVNVASGVTLENYDVYQHGVNAASGSAVGNYVGYSDTSQFGGTLGNYQGVGTGQGNQAHVTGNVSLFDASGNWTLVDGGFSSFRAGANGGTVTGQMQGFAGGGNWVNTSSVDMFGDYTQISGVQTNNYFSADLRPVIATSHGFFGVSVQPQIAVLTGGNAAAISLNPNIDATGGENVDGLSINMNQSSSVSGQVRAIDATGDVGINGHFNAIGGVTAVSGSGNPVSVHGAISMVTVPPSATIVNDEVLGINTAMLLTLGANSTSTAGAFGLGYSALGLPMVLTTHSGATADIIGGAAFAVALDSGNDGGTVDKMYLGKFTAIPEGGTQTINNLYSLWVHYPYGDPATNSWGLYAEDGAYNWMHSNLKIGGTSGSTDRVSDAALGLEVDGKTAFNGNVGIGSNAPAVQLMVDGGSADVTTGKAVVALKNSSANYGPQISMNNDNANSIGHNWKTISGQTLDAVPGGYMLYDNTASAYRMVIDPTGLVGIGTTAPTAKLVVAGSPNATHVALAYSEGHLKSSQTTPPVATVNANAGTGATCAVANATDTAGTIALTTTAILSAAGTECSVAFDKSYNVAPVCTVTPISANAVLDSVIQGVYFTTSTTALQVVFANTDAVGRAYSWAYHCIETQ